MLPEACTAPASGWNVQMTVLSASSLLDEPVPEAPGTSFRPWAQAACLLLLPASGRLRARLQVCLSTRFAWGAFQSPVELSAAACAQPGSTALSDLLHLAGRHSVSPSCEGSRAFEAHTLVLSFRPCIWCCFPGRVLFGWHAYVQQTEARPWPLGGFGVGPGAGPAPPHQRSRVGADMPRCGEGLLPSQPRRKALKRR